jgi:hypothetical protein
MGLRQRQRRAFVDIPMGRAVPVPQTLAMLTAGQLLIDLEQEEAHLAIAADNSAAEKSR